MILIVRLFTGVVCTSLLLYLGIALYIASVHKPKSTWGATQRRDVQAQAVKILQTTKSKESNTIHERNEKPITTIQKPVNITRQQIKTIILILPFRNRKVHYEKLMKHLKTIHRPDWDIHKILVEQANDEPFQRAWLLNIGISEAKRRFGNATACVVTHDIDMFADEKVDYSWCDRPTQICSELSCYNWKIPYKNSAGGVVQANMGHWYKINGFTNNGKGWGGEDDDLHHRFRINGLLDPNTRALRRPVKGYGRCTCMHDEDHTKRVRDNKGYVDILKKLGRMSRGSDEWKTDGLNSLKYYITSEHRDMFDTIHLKVHHSKEPLKQITDITVLYANLPHRTDRKNHMKSELIEYGFDINNINPICEEWKENVKENLPPCVQTKNGQYGALLSHMRAIKIAIQNNLDQVMVVEDDMKWAVKKENTIDILNQNLKDEMWSVLLLSCLFGRFTQRNTISNHLSNCQTSTAYIVRKPYYETLYNHWNSYLERKLIFPDIYKRTIINGYEVALDQSWKILQNQHKEKWAVTNPVLVYQRQDVSDIEHREVNYGKPNVPEHMKRTIN
jgi:GR25 family glycosyltransferase involved in LPS biosynthesis